MDKIIFEGNEFNSDELKLVFQLCIAFCFLDADFSDEESEYLENLCIDNNLEYEEYFADNDIEYVLSQSNLNEFCRQNISKLKTLDLDMKEVILSVLFELSLSDNFLHIEEKKFLQEISNYWDLKVVFGKGLLNWSEEQKKIIDLHESDRIMVDAAPGSGKTAVACGRISHLIDKEVEPSKIWLVSFTNSAIDELKNRISLFSDEPESILGLKISTVDSRAWNLRYGFRDEIIGKLFKGYETNIEEALEIIKKNIEIFEEEFDDLEHLIIDEAQDITGIRLDFLKAIIKLLPQNCGVTVFGDKAQAIYGLQMKMKFLKFNG